MKPLQKARHIYNTSRRIYDTLRKPQIIYLMELSTQEEIDTLYKAVSAMNETAIIEWAQYHPKRTMNIETMDKMELMELAKAFKVPYYSHKSKEELFAIMKDLLKW